MSDLPKSESARQPLSSPAQSASLGTKFVDHVAFWAQALSFTAIGLATYGAIALATASGAASALLPVAAGLGWLGVGTGVIGLVDRLNEQRRDALAESAETSKLGGTAFEIGGLSLGTAAAAGATAAMVVGSVVPVTGAVLAVATAASLIARTHGEDMNEQVPPEVRQLSGLEEH